MEWNGMEWNGMEWNGMNEPFADFLTLDPTVLILYVYESERKIIFFDRPLL